MIRRQSTTRYDTVDVRVSLQSLSPGMQNAEGHQAISYNSCRNRHCPKCQTNAREKWLCARRRELLPVGYYHLVFSVPHALVPLLWQNKRCLFGLLFDASAATLLEVAADPARLGGEIAAANTLIAMPTECGRAATRDGAKHFELSPGERIAIAFEELASCPADDIGHLPGWSCHA